MQREHHNAECNGSMKGILLGASVLQKETAAHVRFDSVSAYQRAAAAGHSWQAEAVSRALQTCKSPIPP